MNQPPPHLQPVIALFRSGDPVAALAAAELALESRPDDLALLELAALGALRQGEAARALPWLQRHYALTPQSRAVRYNLASTLAALGQADPAIAVAQNHSGDPKLARLAGYLLQQAGRHDGAIEAYRVVVAAVPDDWESWNNLANSLGAINRTGPAIEAFERAINSSPNGGTAEIFLNLLNALGLTEHQEQRLRTAEEAFRRFPDHPDTPFELGVAQLAAGQLKAAESTLKRAAEAEGGFGRAAMELGMMYETANRLDELDEHVAECERRGGGPELAFLQAWSLRRRDRFEEAARAARRIPATINPARTAQLRAEIADRLGETDEAFTQFQIMNEASLAAEPILPGPTYREVVVAETAAMRPLPAMPTLPTASECEPDPVFIVGSPRSGTTLLDTLLRALPELQVIEEMPMLAMVESEFELLTATVDPVTLGRARVRYFELAEAMDGACSGRRIVDKMPLHLTHMPVINRLFPKAAIVLVERHPCDAVLSCFMANLSLSHAMRSYATLDEAARTYDAVFANWTRAVELFPLSVHRVRYERMVENLETEMQALLAFLGLPWNAGVLDNQGNAAKRAAVRTASYAQVGQPLYARAIGRWERYRQHLEPVLPMLAPWVERLGYPPL